MKLFDDYYILDRDLYLKCRELQVYSHCKHKPGK